MTTSSSKTIEKKILPQYFDAVATGSKTFELRLDEDDVQNGDTLILREWQSCGRYTGRSVSRKVGFVLRGEIYGLRENWCIISLLPPVEMRVNQYGNNCTAIGSVENLTIK